MGKLKVMQNEKAMVAGKNLPNLIDEFISYMDVSPKTQETYLKNLSRFMQYLYNNQIMAPKRNDVIAYREELRESCKNTTIQSYISTVRLFFRWTASSGYYPNIADNVRGAKVSRENKKDYLTSSQVKAMLEEVDRSTTQGKRDYAILSLMVTGGLRTIEVIRANIGDLSTAGNSTVLYVQGKGREDKADYVKIAPQVEEILREYMKHAPKKEAPAPLFQSLSNNNLGGRMSTRAISGICKEYMQDAGYDSHRLTAHSLRHTAVTLSLLGGNTLQEAQQFARHANISTTQIYAHNLEKENNLCNETVANKIF